MNFEYEHEPRVLLSQIKFIVLTAVWNWQIAQHKIMQWLNILNKHNKQKRNTAILTENR